jgi:hypothetical protein
MGAFFITACQGLFFSCTSLKQFTGYKIAVLEP